MPRATTTVRWLVLAVLLLSGAAGAIEPSLTCDNDPECQTLASQGMGLFDQGRYLEAHQSLAQAYSRRADPALLYSLARTLHKAGRPREAATYYQKFLDAGAAGDPEQGRKAERYLAQANQESAPASVAAPSLPQSVVSHPFPAAQTAPRFVPLYRKPWLWAILGVALAGGAVSLGIGLATRRPDLSDAIPAHPFSN